MSTERAIYDYPISGFRGSEFILNIPRYFEILSLVAEGSRVNLYINVIPTEAVEPKKFWLIVTGEVFDSEFCRSARYIGSFNIEDDSGLTAHHLFMEYQ